MSCWALTTDVDGALARVYDWESSDSVDEKGVGAGVGKRVGCSVGRFDGAVVGNSVGWRHRWHKGHRISFKAMDHLHRKKD
jgi:hypothetical protein